MKRIMIVGQPGSGKSTLARALGARLDVPVVHVDHIHWMPGWVERPLVDKISLARAAESEDAWVFEGGLAATWPSRLARADLLIVLDLPFSLRAWRVFWRTVRFWGQSRPDLPNDCPERFSREFWLWIWNTRNTNRARILALASMGQKRIPVHILRSPRDVRQFLAGLEGQI
ncbi:MULTISPECIES: AAA family ATPase [unclassified Marinovum]